MLQILSTSNETSTGTELVQNGDFSEVGSDLVTNGDFSAAGINLVSNPNFTDTGTDVIYNGGFDTSITLGDVGSGWANPDGAATYYLGGCKITKGASGFARLVAEDVLGSSAILSTSTSYKITYNVLENVGVTSLVAYLAGIVSGNMPVTLGFNTFYFTSGTNLNKKLEFYNQTISSNITLTDIVVKELGEDWSVTEDTGSVTFANDQVQIISDGSAATGIIQGSILSIEKSYKVTIDVASNTNKFKIILGGGSIEVTGTGVQTFYGVGAGTALYIYRVVGEAVDVVINSISVQELGEGWTAYTSGTSTDGQ